MWDMNSVEHSFLVGEAERELGVLRWRAMKLVVITGASSGIGAATAKAFVRDGCRVVLVARQAGKLRTLADSLGPNAHVEACDASNGDAVLAMAARVMATHGVPDVLVNAAGAGEWKWIEDTSPADGVFMMQAPYFAAFNATHAFMKAMIQRKSGTILHVGSPASILPWPGATGYTAARWALRGLNEALNQDLAGTGVTSSHVVFGRVSSEYFANNPGAEEKIPSIAKTIPTLTPDQCAQILVRRSKSPSREPLYPFMLKFYVGCAHVTPWLVRYLLRTTGTSR